MSMELGTLFIDGQVLAGIFDTPVREIPPWRAISAGDGLTPENVRRAILEVRQSGVDSHGGEDSNGLNKSVADRIFLLTPIVNHINARPVITRFVWLVHRHT